MGNIREMFDVIVNQTNSFNESKIPTEILVNLKKWKWGSYGWTSPASLIITATWKKYFFPNQDCCIIWAKDEKNKPIKNGYSIRSDDESVTIPILAKYDLCTGFCSPNSGMQGSRAIEKMRNLKRININFDSAQKTIFDLKLFALLLNQINELSADQALELLKYEICLAKNIKTKREEANKKLQAQTNTKFDLLQFLGNTKDPELTKCVVAACLYVIYNPAGLTLTGVSDFRTAADARAEKPGDLCLMLKGQPIVAVEVKDKSQTIDWNNITRAASILQKHQFIRNFMYVLENRDSTLTNTVKEILTSDKLKSNELSKITMLSLHDLYRLAVSFVKDPSVIASITGDMLTKAPSIKPETKNSWIEANS